MAQSKKTKTYQQMAEQLAELIDWFESDKVNLDEAVTKYAQAMELLEQMENHLKTAENKIKKISAKFDE
jgi:exodeoxyribonuclease VII small subunit